MYAARAIKMLHCWSGAYSEGATGGAPLMDFFRGSPGFKKIEFFRPLGSDEIIIIESLQFLLLIPFKLRGGGWAWAEFYIKK